MSPMRTTKKPYDYLIVGAGLFGAVFAHEMFRFGRRCLVIEKRNHIGGNTYCKNEDGINIHCYGAHIFHTNDEKVWDFVNKFVSFNNYINSPLSFTNGKLYNLPFNMNTFHQLWGVVSPEQAKEKIREQSSLYANIKPRNLEEQALALVGHDIYYTFIKEYSEKQWGRSATELPSSIIRRIPLRFTFDNNYFIDRYQGIPIGGYNILVQRLLENIDVRLSTDYFSNRSNFDALAETVLFTGPIDAFFNFRFGRLEYRSLRFDHERKEIDNFQGNAVINYPEKKFPYTRIIEHKHFEFSSLPHTIITKEYSIEFNDDTEPYYPINDDKNNGLYKKYKRLSDSMPSIIIGGRLGSYRYYDMHQVVAAAINTAKIEKEKFI